MKLPRIVGIVIQALVLGTFLFLAVGQLVGLEAGARIFRYQAF